MGETSLPTPEVLQEIRRATRHHGVTLSTSLRLSPSQRQRLVRNGTLRQPHPGVLVDPAAPRSALQDLAIAVAAGGWRAGAWGRSSGALWSLVEDHPASPEIVIPYQRQAMVEGATVHRSRVLDGSHLTTRSGIRCVKPLITAIDLAVVLPPIEVAEALIRGVQQRLFDLEGFSATIDAVSRPGRTGLRSAREALRLSMIDDRPAESVLELRFARGPGELIPPYVFQHQIVMNGRRFRIDFAYPEVMLAIEVDGYESRRSRESFDLHTERHTMLVLAGWTVLRFTWKQITTDPTGVARQIRSMLFSLGYVAA